MTKRTLKDLPHVSRIIELDSNELWRHIEPESSRRLLLAGLDAFSARGFDGATTRDIATRADMSPAAVYMHYNVKFDLLQEIVEVAHQAVWDAVSRAVDGVESPSERLRRFAEAFAAWNASNATLARVAEDELRALPRERMGKIRSLRRRMEKLVEGELERGVAEEGFDVPDLRGTTLAILALGADIERWYPVLKRSVKIERLAELHGVLALRMVRPWTA